MLTPKDAILFKIVRTCAMTPKAAILFKIVHTCAKECLILKYKYVQNPWFYILECIFIFIIFNSTAERESRVAKAPGKAAAFSTGYSICFLTQVYILLFYAKCMHFFKIFCLLIDY